jgi:hypothetical protein
MVLLGTLISRANSLALLGGFAMIISMICARVSGFFI